MNWPTKIGLMLLVIPAMLVKGLLWAIGLIPIAIAIKTRGRNSYWWPWFMQPWGNKQEGCPDWWLEDAKDERWPIPKVPVWWWYAMRNTVNGQRYWFHDPDERLLKVQTNWNTTLPMEAQQLLDANRESAYRWVRYKWMIGYRRVWLNLYVSKRTFGQDQIVVGASAVSYNEFWIGWKLGSSVPGLGVTIQPRFNREIGK